MFNTQEKRERALGTKLFLKAHRCNSVKCVSVRKPYRPGLHGKARHSSSELGQQLNEKQKIKASYGIRESQMEKVFSTASKNPGVTGNMIVQLLERRLVHSHEFVIGELAAGNLRDRRVTLEELEKLPRLQTASHREAMALTESRRLAGSGLGWIDIHLLAATIIAGGRLWTTDGRLAATSRRLGVGFPG